MGGVSQATPALSHPKLHRCNGLVPPAPHSQAIGAIATLRHTDGRCLTINVEYNQLDPLLRSTISKEGDVNDVTGACCRQWPCVRFAGEEGRVCAWHHSRQWAGKGTGGALREGRASCTRPLAAPACTLAEGRQRACSCTRAILTPVHLHPPPTRRLVTLPRQHQPASPQAEQLHAAAGAHKRHHL